MLINTMKIRENRLITRWKSGQTEYVRYNLEDTDDSCEILEKKKGFKQVFQMEHMQMQFPLNHKHAITSEGRLFVIGGTFNLTNSYRQTYEVTGSHELVEK